MPPRLPSASRLLALAAMILSSAVPTSAQPEPCESLRQRVGTVINDVTAHVTPDPSSSGHGQVEFSGGIRYFDVQVASLAPSSFLMQVSYLGRDGTEWPLGALTFEDDGQLAQMSPSPASVSIANFAGSLTMRLTSRSGCQLSPVVWWVRPSVWPMGVDPRPGATPGAPDWGDPDLRTLPSVSPSFPEPRVDHPVPGPSNRSLPTCPASPVPWTSDPPLGQ